MDLIYQIQFHSFWHIGSGQTGGVVTNADVIKTQDGLPFIPGKTLKGLLREAAKIINESNTGLVSKSFIGQIFGESGGMGTETHFTNAYLSQKIGAKIIKKKQSHLLFQNIASTAIDENTGQAKKGSLREIQATIPLCLYAKIVDFPKGDKYEKELKYCMQFIKRMGVKRHRGFGRCDWTIVK